MSPHFISNFYFMPGHAIYRKYSGDQGSAGLFEVVATAVPGQGLT
jgi:hypothetical protein